jgi:hypothetical protein
MLTVHLQGGLGNQLFQLGFLDYVQHKSGKSIYLSDLKSPITTHSSEQYLETIFKEWKKLYKHIAPSYIHEHPNMIKQEWGMYPGNTCYVGYFQRYEYLDPIKDSFVKKLHFNKKISEKYPGLERKTFIHVRGGDYKNNAFHELDLTSYYKKCMEKTPFKDFVVFTNDTTYAREKFPSIPIIQESEVDSLYLMSQCGACICVNSSFSWWGAYLKSDRPIYMPSKWFNDPKMEGNYYFKGVHVIDINV